MAGKYYSAFLRGLVTLGMMCVVCTVPYAAELTVKADGSGQYKLIQDALNAAKSGDTVVVYAGTYTEDLSIGGISMPPVKKDNITLKTAPGEKVTVIAANKSNRVPALAAVGADFGEIDYFGFFIYGDNVVVDGFYFIQKSETVNAIKVAATVAIISTNVTIKNCEIEGPGATVDGDFLGIVLTPMDVISLQQGKSALAKNLTVEKCKIHDIPFGFAIANLPQDLGLAVPSPDAIIKNCEFTNCDSGVEMDDGLTTISDCYFSGNQQGINMSVDGSTITNCTIINSKSRGINIDTAENTADEPLENPIVTIDNCKLLNNGETTDGHGIRVQQGTIAIKNTIIAGSGGMNVYIDPASGRDVKMNLDHVDLYQSEAGTGIGFPAEPKSVITFKMTNSIVVDKIGMGNPLPLIDATLENNDLFTSEAQFSPDSTDLKLKNIVNTDPSYNDPANGDFRLKPDSKVGTAGVNQTYLGSQGIKTSITNWMMQ